MVTLLLMILLLIMAIVVCVFAGGFAILFNPLIALSIIGAVTLVAIVKAIVKKKKE